MTSDWNKEMAKLESMSDEELFPSLQGSPEKRAAATVKQRQTSTAGVFVRLILSVALGIGVIFWPYGARCGWGFLGYLAAVALVAVSGVWSAIWSWRHRTGRAHVLSLLLVLWGLVLIAQAVLPRIGYAVPTPANPATWLCR